MMRFSVKHGLRALSAILLLLAGFIWLGHAERSLWLQAPSDALDRYAADRVLPAPPARVEEESLWRLCQQRSVLSRVWAARQALAKCLDGTLARVSNEQLEAMRTGWVADIQDQIAFARKVEAIAAADALPEYHRLRALHQRLQRESGGPILQFLQRVGISLPVPPLAHAVAEASDRDAAAVSQLFVSSRRYTEWRFFALQPATSGNVEQEWSRVRDLGLLATGRMLDHDNARIQPRPYLMDDRASLASRLEWARRAEPRAGEALDRTLFSFLPMMTASATIAVAVAAFLGVSSLIVALFFLVAAAGGLHLIDIAVTGPVALRHLPTRDFGEGIWNLWGVGGGLLWGPAVLFIICMIFAAMSVRFPQLIRTYDRVLRLPLRQWAILLLIAFVLAMGAGIGSAARSELLVLIAGVASALLISRYAPLIRYGASPGAIALYAAPLVGAGLCASLVGNLAQADLGALGIAVLVTVIGIAILMHHWAARLALAALFAVSLTVYAEFLGTGSDPSGLISRLPAHAGARFYAAANAGEHGAPDVKQVEWLIRSAEQSGLTGDGWGWGNVPWNGLPANARAQALPLPAVSDLAIVLPAAVGGPMYAFSLLTIIVGAFIALVQLGFSHAFGAEVRLGQRFLAAIGTFGALTALLRIVVNTGGSLQVLPLTGVPVVFLAHAPAASLFALAYAGLVLGACSPIRRNERGNPQ